MRRAGDSAKPFCLVVAFTAPHDPRRTHEQWHRRYPVGSIDLPPNFRPSHPFDNGELDVRDELLTPRPRDADQTRREIADYHAMIEHVDHAIGQVHATLDELGLGDDTLVAHTADHGLAVGQHGLMGKQNLYEHSTRVPLVIAGPGVPAAEVRNALVYPHDLFPTLLETADVDPPQRCAFASLWPTIRDTAVAPRDTLGCYYKDRQRMVRRGDRKLIAYRLAGELRYQQFDLAADPWEQDAALRPASEIDTNLLSSLTNWQDAVGDPAIELFAR